MSPSLERHQFLRLVFVVEGGLIVLALGLTWALDIQNQHLLKWNLPAVLWGVAATVPMCLLLGAIYFRPVGTYRRIKDFLLEALGPSLAACRWYELLLVGLLAGVGEEWLFRGVLQVWLERWDYLGSILISNLIFGFLHAITLTYALLAFGMGVYFALLMDAPGERSLLTPMLAHGLYDFFAFMLIAHDWRKRQAEQTREEGGEQE